MYENHSKSVDKHMAAAASAAGGPYMRQTNTAIITLISLFAAIKTGLWETSNKKNPRYDTEFQYLWSV